MGLAQAIVAALGVVLWGIAPAAAGADGRGAGSPASEQSGSKGAVPEHGPVDLLQAQDRLDPAAPEPRPDVRAAVEKLRKLAPVFVQKPACHPRGKPPESPLGWSGLTPVGFVGGAGFGPDDRDHGEHGDGGDHEDGDEDGHPGHGPPFCPSPH
jgi:hypothetical protein